MSQEQKGEEDLDLDRVRDIQHRILDTLTEKGIPREQEDRDFLMKAMDGLTKVALGKKKLKIDAGIASSNAEISAMLASVFNDPRLQKAYVADSGGVIPTLPDSLKAPKVVPGELSDVGSDLTGYTAFMKKMQPDDE